MQIESMLEKAKREDEIEEKLQKSARNDSDLLHDLISVKEVIEWRVKFEGLMNHTTLDAI